MSKKIQLSKRMLNHVSICRFLKRGFLCLAYLSASKVVADFGSVDSLNLDRLLDSSTAIQSDLSSIEDLLKAQGSDSSNYLFDRNNVNMTQVLNALNQTFQFGQITFRGQSSKYASLRGLIGGGSWDMSGDLPMGVESNGIWYFTKDLSDSLHNTNSVFHKQLTAQETLTNQMERLINMQTNMLQYISYQLGAPIINDGVNYFASYSDYTNDFDRYYSGYPFMLVNQSWAFLDSLAYTDEENGYDDEAQELNYVWNSLYNDDLVGIVSDFSRYRYQRYGTKWGFDAVTNILLSQSFDFSSIDALKPDVDDTIEDSKQDVTDSLPSPEDQEGAAPGDYEEVEDSRIDTSFLEEAKQDVTSIKFTENLFDQFKSEYNGIFNFSSGHSIDYSFSFGHDSNIQVSDTDLLASASETLSSVKPTVDSFIKIIIGLNKFICLIVLFSLAFKMVSEVFSS